MKNIKYIYLIALVGFLMSSCQEWIDDKEPTIEYSSAWPITGDWWVGEYYDGEFGYGPYSINMYNSSFSEDSIWIDNLYDSGIKVKARKTGTNTFEVTGAPDVTATLDSYVGDGAYVDIIEGQIINTDSVSMRVVLYFPDGSVMDDYYEAGSRKTGFEGID